MNCHAWAHFFSTAANIFVKYHTLSSPDVGGGGMRTRLLYVRHVTGILSVLSKCGTSPHVQCWWSQCLHCTGMHAEPF